MNTKKNVCSCFPPHCRELKKMRKFLFILSHLHLAETRKKKTKKKNAHPLVHPWPKILRRKEEERLKRFGHACS